MDDKYQAALTLLNQIKSSSLINDMKAVGVEFVADGITTDFQIAFHLDGTDEKGVIAAFSGFEALASHYVEYKAHYKVGGDVTKVAKAAETKEVNKRNKELEKFEIKDGLIQKLK